MFTFRFMVSYSDEIIHPELKSENYKVMFFIILVYVYCDCKVATFINKRSEMQLYRQLQPKMSLLRVAEHGVKRWVGFAAESSGHGDDETFVVGFG